VRGFFQFYFHWGSFTKKFRFGDLGSDFDAIGGVRVSTLYSVLIIQGHIIYALIVCVEIVIVLQRVVSSPTISRRDIHVTH